MAEPYYTGDNVPLKFTITDADGAVNPSASEVTIIKPDESATDKTDATISGNEVSYNVPTTVTDQAGRYAVYFVNTLPSGIIRTYKTQFKVIDRPK